MSTSFSLGAKGIQGSNAQAGHLWSDLNDSMRSPLNSCWEVDPAMNGVQSGLVEEREKREFVAGPGYGARKGRRASGCVMYHEVARKGDCRQGLRLLPMKREKMTQ